MITAPNSNSLGPHSKVTTATMLVACILARKSDRFSPSQQESDYLADAWEKDPSLREHLQHFDRPDVIRHLVRRRPPKESPSVPEIEGQIISLFRRPSPKEQQAHIATENVVENWLDFLFCNKYCPCILANPTRVLLFVPEHVNFDLYAFWQEFLVWQFSASVILDSLSLLLNATKLSARGFSVPDVPVISTGVRNVKCAWLFGVVERVASRIEQYKRPDESEKNRKKLEEKLEKESEKYRSAFESLMLRQQKEMEKFSEQLKSTREALAELSSPSGKKYEKLCNKESEILARLPIPLESWQDLFSLCQSVRFDPFELLKQERAENPARYTLISQYAERFSDAARDQINSSRGDILASVLWEALTLAQLPDEACQQEIPCIFSMQPISGELRPAGDDHNGFCYACGIALEKQAPSFEVRRMIFASPDQRPQSGSGKTRPTCCISCLAFSFVCGVKPTEDTAIIKIVPSLSNTENDISVRQKSRDWARMIISKEFHTRAGPYVMLTCHEFVGNNKDKVSDKIGSIAYAFYKLSQDTNEHVLKQMKFLFCTPTREHPFSSAQLLYMHALLEASNALMVKDQKIHTAIAQALRYAIKGEVWEAEYLVTSSRDLPSSFQWNMEQYRQPFLDLWHQESQEDNMTQNSNQQTTGDFIRCDLYQDVAALTGLLFPFVDKLRQALNKNGEKDKSEKEILRDMGKLIEKCKDVESWTYTFASHPSILSPRARLYATMDNHFIFRQAKHFLETKLGIDVDAREKQMREQYAAFAQTEADPETGGNSQVNDDAAATGFTVVFDDLTAAYSYLFQTRYRSDYNQQMFLTKLRLSLYSRFPKVASRYDNK